MRPKEIHIKKQCYFTPNIDTAIVEYATKNNLSYSNAVQALVAKAARVKVEREYINRSHSVVGVENA